MQVSKDLLFDVYKCVKEYGIINEDLIKYLESIFPNKSPDVLEVIKRGITKYIYTPSDRIIWTAIGENAEYLIYPKTFCSCSDFYKRVIIEKKRNFCKHLIAQIICEALDNFKVNKLDNINFNKFIKKMKLKH